MLNLYANITKIDQEQKMVWGYATTEAIDNQGEVIKADAIKQALPDYLKFGNIREMHQASAVGVVKEAEMSEKGLFIGAKIVDESAWAKITEGVYKGFSIGGRVKKRNADNPKEIEEISLVEISVVDRPCNPEAVFTVYKADGIDADAQEDKKDEPQAAADAPAPAEAAKEEVKEEDKKDEAPVDPAPVAEKADMVPETAFDLLEKAGRMISSSNMGELQKIHDACIKMGAKCSVEGVIARADLDTELKKVDELAKAELSETLAKVHAEHQDALKKVVDAHKEEVDSLQKMHSEQMGKLEGLAKRLVDKINELENMPAPMKGVARAIAKGEDMSGKLNKSVNSNDEFGFMKNIIMKAKGLNDE